MWVAKFKAWHDSYMLRVMERLDARARFYYLNVFSEGKKRYITKVALFEGPQAAQAMHEWARDPRCHLIEVSGNQLFYYMEERDGFHNLVLDHRIFFVGPILVEAGFEYWTVASQSKAPLVNLYRSLNRLPFKAKLELISLHRETPRFFASSALEDLTALERKAIEAAKANGYYAIPRRNNAKDIAAKLGLPVTTFSERLRKAEAKLVPAVLESR